MGYNRFLTQFFSGNQFGNLMIWKFGDEEITAITWRLIDLEASYGYFEVIHYKQVVDGGSLVYKCGSNISKSSHLQISKLF